MEASSGSGHNFLEVFCAQICLNCNFTEFMLQKPGSYSGWDPIHMCWIRIRKTALLDLNPESGHTSADPVKSELNPDPDKTDHQFTIQTYIAKHIEKENYKNREFKYDKNI